MKTNVCTLIGLVLLALPAVGSSIDFESLGDGELVTNQFAGLAFQNAIALTAGISLNEFEFPPASGLTVISDNGGAITIQFASLLSSISAYITYLEPVTLQAFDASDGLIGTANSQGGCASNMALSGSPGCAPLELIGLSGLSGIARVTITGSALGGSFVLDDLSFEAQQPGGGSGDVPEPSTWVLVAGALLATAISQARRGRGWMLGGALLAVLIPAKAEVFVNPPHTNLLAVTAGPSQTVTISVFVERLASDPIVIPTGVNLLRVGTDDRPLANLGGLRDDGANGDTQAGDGIYTNRFVFNETQVGTIRLTASVALVGRLVRVQSAVMDLPVIRAIAVTTGIMNGSATTLTTNGNIRLNVPAGTLSTGMLRLSTIESLEFAKLAAADGPRVTFSHAGPALEIRSDARPSTQLDLRFPKALLGSFPAGRTLRAFAMVRSYGEGVEDLLNGLPTAECGGGSELCILVPPETLSRENPFVVRVSIGVVVPDTTGLLTLFNVTGVQPAPGSLTVAGSANLQFSANVQLVNPLVIAPVAGQFVTSPYGWRCQQPGTSNTQPRIDQAEGFTDSNCPLPTKPYFHTGIDLGTGSDDDNDKPVLAVMNGKVEASGLDSGRGGWRIRLRHLTSDSALTMGSVYKHLRCRGFLAGQGADVQGGQLIGRSGRSTSDTNCLGVRPHLHFELAINDQTIDPQPFLEQNLSQLGTFRVQMRLTSSVGSAVVAEVPATGLQAQFSYNVPYSSVASVCNTGFCQYQLVAVGPVIGTQILRTWEVQAAIVERAIVGPPNSSNPLTVRRTTNQVNCGFPYSETEERIYTAPGFPAYTWGQVRLYPLIRDRLLGNTVWRSATITTPFPGGIEIQTLSVGGILTTSVNETQSGTNSFGPFQQVTTATGRLDLNTGSWSATVTSSYTGVGHCGQPGSSTSVGIAQAIATLPITFEPWLGR